MGGAIPFDTDPAAQRVQDQIYAAMTGAERLAIAFRLTATARELTKAGIRARHPHYTEDEVTLALLRMDHGDDVFRKVWPGRPLLKP